MFTLINLLHFSGEIAPGVTSIQQPQYDGDWWLRGAWGWRRWLWWWEWGLVMMGEEVVEVILESCLPSLHSSTAFINLGDPAVKFLCQQFQKINILFNSPIQEFLWKYSVVSIKRTGSLNYFEVFAPPWTFFSCTKRNFWTTLIFFSCTKWNFCSTLFAYYILFA